ncbi:MAG: flavoprotein [Polyangiaceae bacterium]
MADRPRPPAPPSPGEASEPRAGGDGPSAHRPTVALVITGSVAAYKAVMVARLLVQAGVRGLPGINPRPPQFVGPLTLSGITGEPVRAEMFDPAFPGELHVDLATAADLVLVVPATADFLAAWRRAARTT